MSLGYLDFGLISAIIIVLKYRNEGGVKDEKDSPSRGSITSSS